MTFERTWQDIMIEHKTSDNWINEAGSNGIIYCGNLCETILKQEKKIAQLEEELGNSRNPEILGLDVSSQL